MSIKVMVRGRDIMYSALLYMHKSQKEMGMCSVDRRKVDQVNP
jgi:hypothetical protein